MNSNEYDISQKNSIIYKQLLEFTNYLKQIKNVKEISSEDIDQIKVKYSNIQDLIQKGHDADDKVIKEFYIMNYELFNAIDIYVSSQRNFEKIDESFDFVKYNSEGSLIFEENEFIGKSQLKKFDKSWGTFYDSFFNASKKLKDTVLEKSQISNPDEELKNLEILQRTKNIYLFIKKKILFKNQHIEQSNQDQIDLQKQNIQQIEQLSKNVVLNDQVKQQIGQINELINSKNFLELTEKQQPMKELQKYLKQTFTIITTQNSKKEIQNKIDNNKQLQNYQQKRESQFKQQKQSQNSNKQSDNDNKNQNLRSLLLSRNQSPHVSVNNVTNSNINISNSKNYFFKESSIDKQIKFFEDTQELEEENDEQTNNLNSQQKQEETNSFGNNNIENQENDSINNETQNSVQENDKDSQKYDNNSEQDDIDSQQEDMEKTIPKKSQVQQDQNFDNKSNDNSEDDITVTGNRMKGQNYSYRNPVSLLDSNNNSKFVQNDFQNKSEKSQKTQEYNFVNEDLNQLISLEEVSNNNLKQESIKDDTQNNNETSIQQSQQDKINDNSDIDLNNVINENTISSIKKIIRQQKEIKNDNIIQSKLIEKQKFYIKVKDEYTQTENILNQSKDIEEKEIKQFLDTDDLNFQNDIQFKSFTMNQSQQESIQKEVQEQIPSSILKTKKKLPILKQKKKVQIQEDQASKSEIIKKKESLTKLFQSFQNPQTDMQEEDVRDTNLFNTVNIATYKKDSLQVESKQNVFRNSRDESFQKFDKYLEKRNSIENNVEDQENIQNNFEHSNSQFNNSNRYKTLIKRFEKNVESRNQHRKFIDIHFQPNLKSLIKYYEGEIKWAQLYWKRISYMTKNKKNILLKNKNIQSLPLVSKSYLQIFILGLQNIGTIYKDSMIVDFDLENGKFVIQNKNKRIILDDFLPIHIEIGLSNFDKLNFFYNLLEKYLAKIAGSYQSLETMSFENMALYLNFKTNKNRITKQELDIIDFNLNEFMYFIQQEDKIYYLKQIEDNLYSVQNEQKKKQYTLDEVIINFDSLYELKFISN